MDICRKKAYAKINLGLDVLGRRPDGYHEVRMIMQTVDIWDELTLERTESGIVITTDSGELPTDENNLIYQAAQRMRSEFALPGGVRIHLRKKIPIAAGMAGGSTDAAAAMKGISELYGLEAPEERLMELGVRIGADVPYCIMGGTALAEGIGERLTRLPAAPGCTLVVVKPDLNVSTGEVYTRLDALERYEHPDIDGMIDAIGRKDLAGVAERLGNVLEPVTMQICPPVRQIRAAMRQLGAMGSLMSGSGPTVFGIFEDAEKARAAARVLETSQHLKVKQSFVTTFIQGFPKRRREDAG